MRLFPWLFISLSMLLGACGGSGETPAPIVRAIGKVHLSSPIAGARIVMHDENGVYVASAEHSTDAAGIFHIALPADKAGRFRLMATGGTHEGVPFTDTLLLDVDSPSPVKHPLYLNAATTLISRYRDSHPDTSVAEAGLKVKSFVQIPLASNAGFSVDNPRQNHFRHEVLLDAMQASGSADLSSHLDGLIAEMDAGVSVRSFGRKALGAPLGMAAFEKLMGFLGKELENEALGLIFEKLSTELGLDGTAEILAELHEIQQQLEHLSELTEEVLSLQQEELMQNILLALNPQVEEIKWQYQKLTTLSQSSIPECARNLVGQLLEADCPEVNQARMAVRQVAIKEFVKEVLEGRDNFEVKLKIIAGLMIKGTGTSLEPGLYARTSDFLKTKRAFNYDINYPEMVSLHEYYQTLQAMGTHLVVEASMAPMHENESAIVQDEFRKVAKKRANEAVDFNSKVSTAQNARLEELRFKNPEVVEQLRTNLVWLRKPISNLKRPTDFGIVYYDIMFHPQSLAQCSNLARSNYADFNNWRLPTEKELHAMVKGSPNTTGDATGGSGIFAWLLEQGFDAAPGDGSHNQRGILVDASMATAYFSSTMSGASGGYYEALWDYGVDGAESNPIHTAYGAKFPYIPEIAGAWCVADQSAGEH